MAAKIVWLDQAEDDLFALFSYLYPRNPAATMKYIADVRLAIERLGDFPLLGRVYDDRYRLIVKRNHLIFYRYDELRHAIIIARIIDSRRDVPKVL